MIIFLTHTPYLPVTVLTVMTTEQMLVKESENKPANYSHSLSRLSSVCTRNTCNYRTHGIVTEEILLLPPEARYHVSRVYKKSSVSSEKIRHSI